MNKLRRGKDECISSCPFKLVVSRIRVQQLEKSEKQSEKALHKHLFVNCKIVWTMYNQHYEKALISKPQSLEACNWSRNVQDLYSEGHNLLLAVDMSQICTLTHSYFNFKDSGTSLLATCCFMVLGLLHCLIWLGKWVKKNIRQELWSMRI